MELKSLRNYSCKKCQALGRYHSVHSWVIWWIENLGGCLLSTFRALLTCMGLIILKHWTLYLQTTSGVFCFCPVSQGSGKLPLIERKLILDGSIFHLDFGRKTNYYVFASWARVGPGISQWAVGSCFWGLNFTSPLLVLFVSKDSSPMKCWLSQWPTYQLFGIIFTRHKHFKFCFMVYFMAENLKRISPEIPGVFS